MPHDYHRLSSTDFEALAADLAGALHGVRFERFCEGRDGGIDFRHVGDDGRVTIGQAKRYKTAAQLLAKIGDELPKLQRLQPARYLLMTACALTPANKAALCTALAPWLLAEHIYGQVELDDALARHPAVLRRHFKLWLGDAAQLNAVLHNALHQSARVTLAQRVWPLAQKFVPYGAADEVGAKLAAHHYCLITGDPGIGKSALAAYTVLRYVADNPTANVVWICDRRVDHALALVQPGESCFVVLDDFLGATFLSKELTRAFAQDLQVLLGLAQESAGRVKVVLTTRDYVLEQANWRLDQAHAGLAALAQARVGLHGFSYRVRGEILFNQVRGCGFAAAQRAQWLREDLHGDLLRYRHFNPRMSQQLLDTMARQWPHDPNPWLQRQLNDPRGLWVQPLSDLSAPAQCLLYVLALTPDLTAVDDLAPAFDALYRALNGQVAGPGALDAALLEVEPSFASSEAHCQTIWLHLRHGGVADLLQQQIAERPLLAECLIDSLARFEQGLHLFCLTADDARPVKLAPQLRHKLLQRLTTLLDAPAHQLMQRQTHVKSLEEGRAVWQNAPGTLLAKLWQAAQPDPQAIAQLLPLLRPWLAAADWPALFSKGQTAPLLNLLFHLPAATRQTGWQAARSAMCNSEDAAAIAVACQADPEAAGVLNANPRQLSQQVQQICRNEIDRAADEYHIGAVLGDIGTIEDALGIACADAKVLGNARLESIFSGQADEDDDTADYFAASEPADALRWAGLAAPGDVAAIDRLFEEWAAEVLIPPGQCASSNLANDLANAKVAPKYLDAPLKLR